MDNIADMEAVGGRPQREADAMFPQTPAATAAFSVGARFYSPALLNHCVRSYLWGAMYGAANGIAFDDELLYVSAMLHDISLTDAFDSHRLPFEEAGGDLAWVFGVAAGWPADRAARATEIIVTHMRYDLDISPAADPESHILQVATSWEIVGRRPEEFPPEARADMLARYPRQGFGSEFLACFEDQAMRKPNSTAAVAVANDVSGLIAANPLEGRIKAGPLNG
ncbi:cyanamide hydratase [Mycobacterium sp. URHB0021]